MAKVSKENHEKIRRALTMYERTTGESVAGLIDAVEVDSGEDLAAKREAHDKAYAAQAELNAKVEATEQAQRRAQAARDAGDLQPGNPGAGQEALVTERAKALGIQPAGKEPATAAPVR
jgi:hypothetical protein